jgi:hypothetical protein
MFYLSVSTPKEWTIKLVPFLPGFFVTTPNEYSKYFVTHRKFNRSAILSVNNWVTHGFGYMYALEYQNKLTFN